MAGQGSDCGGGEDSSIWLDLHRDPVAGLNVVSEGLALTDLDGKGNVKLLAADLGDGKTNMQLRVWDGSFMLLTLPLMDIPTGIATFHMSDGGGIPVTAVACGAHVFIYKNLRAYYKFTLKPIACDPKEASEWDRVRENAALDPGELALALEELKRAGTRLTTRSLEFLAIDGEDDQRKFIATFRDGPLQHQPVITAISLMYKSISERGAVSCLVVGSEACEVSVLSPNNFQVLATVELPSPPALMSITGQFDIDYRIVVACRDGKIYTIKNGTVAGAPVALPAHPVGLVRLSKSIFVGCMDDKLRCYSTKGKRLWVLPMPAAITAVALLSYTPKAFKGILVGLENGEIRVYQDKKLVSTFQVGDAVTGLTFGQFGRDEGTLVVTTRKGELIIKKLRRHATLTAVEDVQGPPPEQAVRINVPSKTKLYVDQTNRERANSVTMHRLFQKDLFQLRLRTAREYVKALSSSLTPLAANSRVSMKVNAEVHGIGPVFRLVVTTQNTSPELLTGLVIALSADPAVYRLDSNALAKVNALVPGVRYDHTAMIACLTEEPISSPVTVFVSQPPNPQPIVTAIVNMPVAEGLVTIR